MNEKSMEEKENFKKYLVYIFFLYIFVTLYYFFRYTNRTLKTKICYGTKRLT